jgi:AraC-like DNA-binding protein
MTRRYASNLILAITATPFGLGLPGQSAKDCWGAICSSRALRCVDATDTPFISLNLDPGTQDARRLESLLAGLTVRTLDSDVLSGFRDRFTAFLHGRLSGLEAQALCSDVLTSLTGSRSMGASTDLRVKEITTYLKQHCLTDINLPLLAKRVGLSASRLSHLFSKEMGLSISQLLLWIKMRRAVVHLQSGRSLTEIALDCGFSDSSHLIRSFRSFYGIKPSTLANSDYVQLTLC